VAVQIYHRLKTPHRPARGSPCLLPRCNHLIDLIFCSQVLLHTNAIVMSKV
jgi:hypothetical protein